MNIICGPRSSMNVMAATLARLACWKKLRRRLRVLSEIELVRIILSSLQNPESSKI